MPEETVVTASPTPVATPSSGLPAGMDVEHYNRTGDLKPLETTTKPAASSPAEAKPADSPSAAANGSESATDDEPVSETPAERKKRTSALRSELDRANKRIRDLESQFADSRKPAPAADEPRKDPVLGEKRPRLSQFKEGTADEQVAAWEDATEAWDARERKREVQAALSQRDSESEGKREVQSWRDQLKAGHEKYADFDAVVNPTVTSSILSEQIMKHPQGMEIAYWLGKNPEDAAEIARDTDIDGLESAALFTAADKDPKIRARVIESRGAARAFLSVIARRLKSETEEKPASTATRTTVRHRPSSEVTVSGQGGGSKDPLAEAYRKGDFLEISRLEDERAAKGRR